MEEEEEEEELRKCTFDRRLRATRVAGCVSSDPRVLDCRIKFKIDSRCATVSIARALINNSAIPCRLLLGRESQQQHRAVVGGVAAPDGLQGRGSKQEKLVTPGEWA